MQENFSEEVRVQMRPQGEVQECVEAEGRVFYAKTMQSPRGEKKYGPIQDQAMRGVNRRLKEKARARQLGQSHVSHGEQCGFYFGGVEGF